MSKYKNGEIPANLLVRRGSFLLTAGTWAKWDALVADVKKRFNVTLRITDGVGVMKGTGAYRDRPMQRAVRVYYTKLGRPWQAAAEGTSSHGGEFKGQDALAVDVTNYFEIKYADFCAACRRAGFEPDYFDGKNGKPLERWHIIDRDPYRVVGKPAGGASRPTSKEIEVIPYHREDPNARGAGRTLAPGGAFWLHTTKGAKTSHATNIVGGVGTYSITTHVYAEGTPGDVLYVKLFWDNTKTSGPHSGHYTEALVFDRNGQIRASNEFKRAVAAGYAVYVNVAADAKNKGKAKVTLLDSDAFLFTA
jgi:hypothetical protein